MEVAPENVKAFEKYAKSTGLSCENIGKVAAKDFMLNSISIESEELEAIYYGSFDKMMHQDI